MTLPIPTDSDFPADDAIVDAFNGHEAERDYWRGHFRAIEAGEAEGDALASRRAWKEAQQAIERVARRLSDGYRRANSDTILRSVAGD